MAHFENLKAFAYRLAAAALRVGVVLGVALPLIVLAARPWRTAEQVANESSGKRPSAIVFARSALISDAGGVTFNSHGLPCAEVAVTNQATTDIYIWIVQVDADPGYDECLGGTYDATQRWPLKASQTFVTRMPAQSGLSAGKAAWAFCYYSAVTTPGEYVYSSCLVE